MDDIGATIFSSFINLRVVSTLKKGLLINGMCADVVCLVLFAGVF